MPNELEKYFFLIKKSIGKHILCQMNWKSIFFQLEKVSENIFYAKWIGIFFFQLKKVSENIFYAKGIGKVFF